MLHGGGGGGAAKRAGGVAFAVPDTPVDCEARSAGQVASDVLLYRNPPLTYLVAAAGVVALAAMWFALRGAHGLTLLTGGMAGGAPRAALEIVGCPSVVCILDHGLHAPASYTLQACKCRPPGV